MRLSGHLVWILATFIASSTTTWAQELPTTEETQPTATSEGDATKPWNRGVTEERKAKAQTFFEEGNKQFERSQYGNALKEYRKAIEHRDHPAIRYNIAVCLIHLDQVLEAYQELEASLEFGEAPLGEEAFKQGRTYKKLLLGRLAELKVHTDEADARVTLNGELLMTGPGEITRLVLPTKLQIVATKADRLPLTTELVPIPGEVNDVELKMRPLSEGLVYRRRWARWKPWAIVAGGAGVALLGIPFFVAANDKVDSYDLQVARICPNGCPDGDELPGDVKALRSEAKLEQTVSVSMIALGSVAAAAGIALVWLNQPVPVHDEATLNPLNVTPVPGGAVGSYSFTF